MNFLHKAFSVVSQMLFPENITCLSCGAELDGTETQKGLCKNCTLEYNKDFCESCGRKIQDAAHLCEACITRTQNGERAHFDAARSSVVFNETARKLIHAFKYGEAKYLAGYFAGYMAETLCGNFSAVDLITFVPLHKKRQRKRGFNQAELIAEALSSLSKLPKIPLLCKTAFAKKNLAKLTRAERARQIAGTFEVFADKAALKDKSVLLVDDVFTTGATTDECAKVLKKAGANTVYVLTFASVFIKPNAAQKQNELKNIPSIGE